MFLKEGCSYVKEREYLRVRKVRERKIPKHLLSLETGVLQCLQITDEVLDSRHIVCLCGVAVQVLRSKGRVDRVDCEIHVKVELHIVGDGMFLASKDQVHAQSPSLEELVLAPLIEGLQELDD